MRCPDCGKEMNGHECQCPDCGSKQPHVSVLTPQERETFQGITINQDQGEEDRNYQESGSRASHRVHIKQVHLGGGGFLNRLLITLAIMAFLAALVFVALPLVLAVIAAVLIISFIMRMFK